MPREEESHKIITSITLIILEKETAIKH